MAGECGSCTACCRVFTIPEIKKDFSWCKHCEIGVGCKIYSDRPEMCREFKCLWLDTQLDAAHPNAKLPLEMRPDKSKVVVSTTTHPRVISFITMHGSSDAWRKGKIYELAVKLVKSGKFFVAVGTPGSTTRKMLSWNPIFGHITEKEVHMTAPDENGMQWNID